MSSEQPPSGDSASTAQSPSAAQADAAAPKGGCLPEIEIFGSGLVLSWFSPTFYIHAARRKVISALLFFFVFTSAIAVLQSISLTYSMFAVRDSIVKAYEQNHVPTIRIEDGIAEVDGPEPLVLMDQNEMLVVVDTTGQHYTEADLRRYQQGFLINRTELLMLQQGGRLQSIPLASFHEMLNQNPIVIDKQWVAGAWDTFTAGFGIASLIALWLWHVPIRLAYMLVLALVMWGIASLFRKNTGFGPVLITGMYALVPALIVRFMLSLFNFYFPSLVTLILVFVWSMGLIAALRPLSVLSLIKPGLDPAAQPLRAWRVLIGLPLLIDIVLELIFHWNAVWVTWGLAVVTMLTLAAISLIHILPHLQTGSPNAS
jgi:hypothetical protein